MYKNIGKKVKVIARIILWVGLFISGVIGFLMIDGGLYDLLSDFNPNLPMDSMYENPSMFITVVVGICVIVFGILCSWICSSLVYGFGEIIERLSKLTDNTRDTRFLTGYATLIDKVSDIAKNTANSAPHIDESNTWSCEKCTKQNPENNDFCMVCGEHKISVKTKNN